MQLWHNGDDDDDDDHDDDYDRDDDGYDHGRKIRSLTRNRKLFIY